VSELLDDLFQQNEALLSGSDDLKASILLALQIQNRIAIEQARLSERTGLEMARANQAETEVIEAMQKIAIAESRRSAAVEQLLAEVGDVTIYLRRYMAIELGRLSALLRQFLLQQPLVEAINENAEVQAHQLERIYRSQRYLLNYHQIHLQLIATTHHDDNRVDGLRVLLKRIAKELATGELNDPKPLKRERGQTIQAIRSELAIQYENLETLKMRAAKHGASPPLNLMNEITDIETQIELLEDRLQRKEGNHVNDA
jgi:hypothetical protein